MNLGNKPIGRDRQIGRENGQEATKRKGTFRRLFEKSAYLLGAGAVLAFAPVGRASAASDSVLTLDNLMLMGCMQVVTDTLSIPRNDTLVSQTAVFYGSLIYDTSASGGVTGLAIDTSNGNASGVLGRYSAVVPGGYNSIVGLGFDSSVVLANEIAVGSLYPDSSLAIDSLNGSKLGLKVQLDTVISLANGNGAAIAYTKEDGTTLFTDTMTNGQSVKHTVEDQSFHLSYYMHCYAALAAFGLPASPNHGLAQMGIFSSMSTLKPDMTYTAPDGRPYLFNSSWWILNLRDTTGQVVEKMMGLGSWQFTLESSGALSVKQGAIPANPAGALVVTQPGPGLYRFILPRQETNCMVRINSLTGREMGIFPHVKTGDVIKLSYPLGIYVLEAIGAGNTYKCMMPLR
jgi:hypothetical protein